MSEEKNKQTSTNAGHEELSTTDQCLLTKLLLRSDDTGDVVLGRKNGIVKTVRATLDGKITLMEYNLLRAILSMQLDNNVMSGGEIVVSASQLFRAIRHGKKSGKVHHSQQAEIHQCMLRLERRIHIMMNDPCRDWLSIKEERLRNMRILHFDFDEGFIHGNRTDYYYTIYNVGILSEIAYKTRMIERIPQQILAIQERHNGTLRNWSLTEKRINIRTVLEIFIFQLLRVNGTITNKKPYHDIFTAAEVGTSSEQTKRAKKDIAVILDYWRDQCGLFDSWHEYGNGVGIIVIIKEVE